MKKPFKETKFGKLLNEKLPDAIAVVGDVLPDKGVLGIVKNIIDSSTLTIDEKEELKAQMLEFEKLELEDRKDARQMQVEALRQDDLFSKRFIYYLASFIIISATGFGFMMYFIEVPKSNQRLVEMFADIYLFAGALMILQFFFGSADSSRKKDQTIKELSK